MAKINGKSKGNTFERKIANKLSDRFKEVTGKDQSFRRNADSGSFFGGKNQQRAQTHDLEKATFGDIICPNEFNFSIECKHYKTAPSFKSIVEGKVTQWDAWLSQAEQDAVNSGKKVMLIIKYNNVDEAVFVMGEFADKTILKYKGYSLLSLDNLLSFEDNYFFHYV
jgi:hypothetical protein